jgi:hypothetical protein
MFRRVACLVLPLALLTGCHRLHGPNAMPPTPSKPAPAAQMKFLEPMLGNWAGTGDIVDPDPETIKAMMPESERAEFKSTFAGGSKGEWALGGTALQMTGWYEMPDGQKGNYLEYWTWDAREGKFRTWFASDWSEAGAGWAIPSADGKCFCVEGSSYDAMCNKKKFDGCMCVKDNDTLEWNFTEKSPMGRFTMHGTSKRQK